MNTAVYGERGVIINTSSVSVFEEQIGQASYAVAKAGASGMTLVLARGPAVMGIRCNAIVPGFFRTPRVEGAPQTLEEDPIINSKNIRIDSGMRMGPKWRVAA